MHGLIPNFPCYYYLPKGLGYIHINSVEIKQDKELLKT